MRFTILVMPIQMLIGAAVYYDGDESISNIANVVQGIGNIVFSAITLSREFQLLFEGIGEAVGPIFSVYVGEKSREGLRSIYSLANKTAITEGIIVTIVLIIIAPAVPSVLDVTDPELVHWVVMGVSMTALGAAFVSLLYLLTSYYLVIEQIALGLAACAMRVFPLTCRMMISALYHCLLI